jgi:F-type H+-transporting ATPase subunit gamma
MSRRRELEARLALFGELSGILNAVRSFALVELRRLAQHEAAQQQSRDTLELAMGELCAALPPPQPSPGDIWIALGSARGFCAGLNDEVLRFWQEQGQVALASIAVGERLSALMPAGVIAVPGPAGAADAVAAIDRILEAVDQARRVAGPHAGLVLCYRDERAVTTRRLLPLPGAHTAPSALPLTNEPAAEVALGVAQHYLFHTLLALLLGACAWKTICG